MKMLTPLLALLPPLFLLTGCMDDGGSKEVQEQLTDMQMQLERLQRDLERKDEQLEERKAEINTLKEELAAKPKVVAAEPKPEPASEPMAKAETEEKAEDQLDQVVSQNPEVLRHLAEIKANQTRVETKEGQIAENKEKIANLGLQIREKQAEHDKIEETIPTLDSQLAIMESRVDGIQDQMRTNRSGGGGSIRVSDAARQ